MAEEGTLCLLLSESQITIPVLAGGLVTGGTDGPVSLGCLTEPGWHCTSRGRTWVFILMKSSCIEAPPQPQQSDHQCLFQIILAPCLALFRSFWLRLAEKCPERVIPRAVPRFLSHSQRVLSIPRGYSADALGAFLEIRKKRERMGNKEAGGPSYKGHCLPGLSPGWTSKLLSPGMSL